MVARRSGGFTLVEMVIVIVISGVLSLVVMQFITAPIEVYVDQSRRTRLVDKAQAATQRIAYDVRLAVPNSIRVGCGGSCVELMRAATGGRYRLSPPGDVLSFTAADLDTSFETLGYLNHTGDIVTSTDPDACADGTASCVVIYNTGFSGTDLWHADNRATLTALNTGPPITLGFDNSRFSTGQTAFPAQSPGQRFYLTDTAVTFICDPVQGTVRRYWGYSPQASQLDSDTHAELIALSNPAEHALLTDQLGGCRFEYSPGTPTRHAVLTLSLTLGEAGESITLLEQVSVSNQP